MDIDVISAKIKEINTIFPADIRIVHCNKIDVSSTMIRSNIKKHQDNYRSFYPEKLLII